MSPISTYRHQSLGERLPQKGEGLNTYSTARRTYLLTQGEVSQLFRVTVRTVQRWTRLHLIPSVKLGGVTRYDIDEVRRSLRNGDHEVLSGLEIFR